MSNITKIRFDISGEFDLHTRKVTTNPDGSESYGPLQHRHSGTNLVTDAGLNNLGTQVFQTWAARLRVGSGNTAPTNGDTALVSLVASATGGTHDWVWDGTSRTYIRVFTFGTGNAAGILAELGLDAGSGSLNTRALFTDSGGSPVTVTVLSDEQLIVTYRIKFTASETDSVLNVTQNSVDYTLTLRPSGLGNTAKPAGVMNGSLLAAFHTNSGQDSGFGMMYTGVTSAIGATNGVPTGASSVINGAVASLANDTYVSTSLKRVQRVTFGLTQGNTANFGALRLDGAPFAFQLGISPRLNKTNLQVMVFTVETTWGRAP